MIVVSDVEQGTPEWFELRCGVVTGTGFAKVLAKGRGNQPSKVRTEYLRQIACERITGQRVEEGGFSSYWMQRGTELEPEARAAFEFLTGETVETPAFVYADKTKLCGVSPDGICLPHFGLELKAPKLTTHIDYLLNGESCPNEYVAQIQGAMWVTGFKRWWFASYHPDAPKQLHAFEVMRDNEYIEKLSSAVKQFETDIELSIKQLTAICGLEQST